MKNDKLEKIVKESGLQLSDGEQIKLSYSPFFEQIAIIEDEAKKIDFDNPTQLDEEIARKLRLRSVTVRKRSEDVKIERKKIHQLKANLEQDAWNLIKSTCSLNEETFLQVEKKREIELKAKQDVLRVEREKEVEPYNEFLPEGLDYGKMSDDNYSKVLHGAKLLKKDKEQEVARAVAKAKAEQIAFEKEQARIRKENAKLRKEADEREKAEKIRIEKEKKEIEAKTKLRSKRNEELRSYIVFIRDYNKLIDLPEKEYQKEFVDIKKGAQAQWDYDREMQAKEAKKKQDLYDKDVKLKAKLKAESEKREKIEAELKAKKDAEAKAEAERKEKIENELKKGDDLKIKDFINDLKALKTKYSFKSVKYKSLYSRAGLYIDKLIENIS